MKNVSDLFRLALVLVAVMSAGCKSGDDSTAAPTTNSSQPATVLLTQVAITDYVVVSTRRVGRTVTEYTMRAVASNNSANRYTNVTASLISAPAHIKIIDGNVAFGTVNGNGNTTSADSFVIEVDLSVKTILADLAWSVNGTPPSTGGGGGGSGGSPTEVGIFMNIDDNAIKGDARSASHRDWIELLSFSEGSSNPVGDRTGGGRTAGKVSLEDVTVTKLLDRSSTLLRQALADGTLFTEVKIDVIKQCGGNPYTEYAITLTVSALTSLQASASGTQELPRETLSLNFSRIETMYTPVGPGCRFEPPLYSFQDAIAGV